MWKKITYYALMIIFGFLFMTMVTFSVTTNTETKFIKKSVSSGDYTNALKVYASYSNTNAIYNGVADNDSNCKVRVFELTYRNVDSPKSDEYNYLDLEYGIALEKSSLNTSNPKADAMGDVYNKTGYVVYNSEGESFTVFGNGYINGNATKKENAYVVHDENGDTSYVDEDKIVEYGTIELVNNYIDDIYMFYVPYQLLAQYSGFSKNDITKIEIRDRDGNVYTTINFAATLAYNSAYLTKVNEMVTVYNAAIDSDNYDAYNAMYDTWLNEYKTIDGANTYLTSSDYVNGMLWFKIIISLILYIVFVLVIGDILVGKRRIIIMFQSLGKKNSGGSFTGNTPIKKATDAPDLMDNVKKGDKK